MAHGCDQQTDAQTSTICLLQWAASMHYAQHALSTKLKKLLNKFNFRSIQLKLSNFITQDVFQTQHAKASAGII